MHPLKQATREFINGKRHEWEALKYEGNIRHDYFRFLPFRALSCLLKERGVTLSGDRVLIAGCGPGTDIHYLRKFYNAVFTGLDISETVVRITQAKNPGAAGVVGDIEQLPFPDGAFDWSFVAATLHHLPHPFVGLHELVRIARKGAIVIEPQDTALCRIATRLGLATEVEETGNYVFRFATRDFQRISRSMFCSCSCRSLFALHRVAATSCGFRLLQGLNWVCNLLAPAQGNYVVGLVVKP